MRISVQTGGFFSESRADECFALLKRCGIESVDYNINDRIPTREFGKGKRCEWLEAPEEQVLAGFAPLAKAAKKNGITFAQMHGPFPMYFKDSPEINEYLILLTERCMAVAQYLGCPAIVVHPYTCLGNKAEETRVNMEMYRRLIPAAKKTGVTVCLENLHCLHNGSSSGHRIGGSCADAAEAVRYIDTLNAEAGEKCFGFCLDVGHTNMTGRSVLEDIRTLGERITLLHVHDNDSVSDLHLMPYSQGPKGVDWEGFIEGLREIGYRGDISFETFMVMRTFPSALHEPVLKLLAAEGAYFRDRILAP